MIGFKRININKDKIKQDLTVYNKPNKVYIPLVNDNLDNVLILVKKGDYVFKGSVIAKRRGENKINVFSSVSGKVIDFEQCNIFNGKKVKCVVIENDFHERIEKSYIRFDNLNSISKIDFINNLTNFGIIENGRLLLDKYNTNSKINTLIIKVFENYKGTEYYVVKEKTEQLLEMIDAILEINKIGCAIIVIKKEDKEILKCINKYIGTYLKIKVVCVSSNLMNDEKKLLRKLINIPNNENCLENGIIINNPSSIYAIYEALKINKPMIEKVVTFLGDGLKKPQNVLVRVGTKVSEIISEIGGIYKRKKTIIVANEIIENISDLVVTPELNTIMVIESKQ